MSESRALFAIDRRIMLEQARKKAEEIRVWIEENNHMGNDVPSWRWAKISNELMDLEI